MPEARSTGRSISNDVKTSARKATQPNFANLGSFLATEPKAASKASRAGEGHPVCGIYRSEVGEPPRKNICISSSVTFPSLSSLPATFSVLVVCSTRVTPPFGAERQRTSVIPGCGGR